VGSASESSQALAFRCRIVLAAAEGRSSTEIAAGLGCNPSTVAGGGAGSRGAALTGSTTSRGRQAAFDQRRRRRGVIARRSSSSRPMRRTGRRRFDGAATGMSQSAVSRIWRAFGLKPHQLETFKLSPDPQFIDKVRDIVGLYSILRGRGRLVRRREVADPGARPLAPICR